MIHKKLLFIDDDIASHDPGEFEDPAQASPGNSTQVLQFESGSHLGDMGYYVRALQAVGIDVVTATGVEEALKCVRSGTPFHAIVVDVMMPYLDTGRYDAVATASGLRTGFVLVEELHSLLPTVPIWILSQVVPDSASLVNAEASRVNKATVDDLVSRGVIAGIFLKVQDSSERVAEVILTALDTR
jgi:CheY-like chemotaxis protein